jgi:hypothetical protein
LSCRATIAAIMAMTPATTVKVITTITIMIVAIPEAGCACIDGKLISRRLVLIRDRMFGGRVCRGEFFEDVGLYGGVVDEGQGLLGVGV